MLVIKLTAKYLKTKPIKENSSKWMVKGDILYYKDHGICELGFFSIIDGIYLYVYKNSLIEEYTMKRYREKKIKHEFLFDKIFLSEYYTNTKPEFDSIETSISNMSVLSKDDSYNNQDLNFLSNIENTSFDMSSYTLVYKLNKMNIYKTSVDRKLEIFIRDKKIHLAYKSCIVTQNTQDIIYKFNIKKSSNNIIDITYKSINNKPKSIYKMLLAHTLFTDLRVNIRNPQIESFIYEICLFENKLSKYIRFNIFTNAILVELYRKIEDKFLFDIDWKILSVNEMKKIILLNTSNLILYLDKCVLEKKEFEIIRIIDLFKDLQERDVITEWLIKRSCFYLLEKILPIDKSTFSKIEKIYIRSSRNKQKYSSLKNDLN
ncbi:hypothetical protein P3W45_000170 [Vairimorpha bombi]|jgi:hypothetical protein